MMEHIGSTMEDHNLVNKGVFFAREKCYNILKKIVYRAI